MKTNEQEMIEQENNEEEKMEEFLEMSHYEHYMNLAIEETRFNPVTVRLAQELIQKFPEIDVWQDIMFQICTRSQPETVYDYTIDENNKSFVVYYDYKHPTHFRLNKNDVSSSMLLVNWRERTKR